MRADFPGETTPQFQVAQWRHPTHTLGSGQTTLTCSPQLAQEPKDFPLHSQIEPTKDFKHSCDCPPSTSRKQMDQVFCDQAWVPATLPVLQNTAKYLGPTIAIQLPFNTEAITSTLPCAICTLPSSQMRGRREGRETSCKLVSTLHRATRNLPWDTCKQWHNRIHIA